MFNYVVQMSNITLRIPVCYYNLYWEDDTPEGRTIDEVFRLIKQKVSESGTAKNSYKYRHMDTVVTVKISSFAANVLNIESIQLVVPKSEYASIFVDWLKDHEISLDESSEWLKGLPQAALEDPNPALAHFFNSKINNNLLGWVIFVQKVMELDDNEKVKMIRQFQLGNVIGQCAELIGKSKGGDDLKQQVSRQVNQLSFDLINAMTSHYFNSNSRSGGLERSDLNDRSQKLQGAVKSFTTLPGDRFTIVFAKDSGKDSMRIVRSVRMWTDNDRMVQWSMSKADWRKHFPGQWLQFTPLLVNDVKLEIMFQTMSLYLDHCHKICENDKLPFFFNFTQIKEGFVHELHTLHGARPEDRQFYLEQVRKSFSAALPADKWVELAKLFERSSITKDQLMKTLGDFQTTPEAAAAMSLAHLPCGEMKIALECCEETGALPLERREALPSTLGARLQFAAFNPRGAKRVDICHKCKEIWPAYEALYWAVRESGLNMQQLRK